MGTIPFGRRVYNLVRITHMDISQILKESGHVILQAGQGKQAQLIMGTIYNTTLTINIS